MSGGASLHLTKYHCRIKSRDFRKGSRWRRTFWGGAVSGMAAEGSGRASFRAWLVRVFPMEPYIGRFFVLLFWGYFGATYISYLFDGREYGVVRSEERRVGKECRSRW